MTVIRVQTKGNVQQASAQDVKTLQQTSDGFTTPQKSISFSSSGSLRFRVANDNTSELLVMPRRDNESVKLQILSSDKTLPPHITISHGQLSIADDGTITIVENAINNIAGSATKIVKQIKREDEISDDENSDDDDDANNIQQSMKFTFFKSNLKDNTAKKIVAVSQIPDDVEREVACRAALNSAIQVMLTPTECYIINDYLPGKTLATYLQEKTNSPLTYSNEQKLQDMINVMEAAQYIHDKNIIHGDLKPENIMMSATGMATVFDFGGSATANFDTITDYTDCYVAPEHFRLAKAKADLPAEKSMDYYAMGLILLNCMGYGYDARGLDQRLLRENRKSGNQTYSVDIACLEPIFDGFKKEGADLKILIQDFFSLDKTKRPDFAEGLLRLQTIQASYQEDETYDAVSRLFM